MSLALDFSINETDDRKQIFVKDLTGAYNVNTNPGGYGAPNPTVGSILDATITLALRDAGGIFNNAPIPTVSVFPTLPNLNLVPAFITAQQFGYGATADAVFSDGIYRATYTETGIALYSKTDYFVLTKQIDCCIKTKSDKVSGCKCNCDGLRADLQNIMFHKRLLDAAICCTNFNDIQNQLDILARLCANCGCGC